MGRYGFRLHTHAHTHARMLLCFDHLFRSSIDRLASSFQIRNMTPDDVLSLGIVICGIESVPTLIHLQIPLSINNMVSLYLVWTVFTNKQ